MKIITICSVFLSGLFLSGCTLNKFPIKLYNCEKGYKDCFAVAKYDDMYSCERANQKYGWYCDETDKSHIICEEKESLMVDSYCSK